MSAFGGKIKNILDQLTYVYVITDVNECSNNPCKNGATCVNLPGSYRCNCKSGYTGNTCQTGVNFKVFFSGGENLSVDRALNLHYGNSGFAFWVCLLQL